MFDRTTCAQPAGFVCDSQRRLHRAGLSPISAATDGQSTWPSRPVPDSTASRSASTSRRPQPSRGANGSSVAPGGGCPAPLPWSARPPRRAAAGCCPAGGGRWPPRLGGGWCRVAGRGRDGCGGPPRPCLGSAPPPLACVGSACPPPPPPATTWWGGVGWGRGSGAACSPGSLCGASLRSAPAFSRNSSPSWPPCWRARRQTTPTSRALPGGSAKMSKPSDFKQGCHMT